MVRMTVLVSGRVQLVGYRMFAERSAARIGAISGTVRNLPDGSSVEVIADGSRAVLEECLADLRVGPAHALVRSVEVEWGDANSEFAEFVTVY